MNLNKEQRNGREFQRGMDTDELRHTRQNERLQLIKKEREQRKANKRRTFGRNTQNNDNISARVVARKQHFNCNDNKNTPISYHVRGIPVKIIDNVNDCDKYINQLLSNNPPLLGCDCEWKPIQNKQEYNRVSLLQLCDNNICLLLKMIDIEKSGNFALNLIQLLKNANIIKVGLSISSDKEKLYRDYKIDVNGCVDIKKFILKKCSFIETNNDSERRNIDNYNLTKICNYMFGYNAFIKNKEITLSNWELNPLTKSQIIYAACDVIYCYYAFLQCILNYKNSKLNYSLISNNESSKIISFAGAIVNNIDIVQLCDDIIEQDKKQIKETHCVVCGMKNLKKFLSKNKFKRLRRFCIFPSMYIRYFDKKTKQQCDILLCPKCSSKAQSEQDAFEKRLSKEYNISSDFDRKNWRGKPTRKEKGLKTSVGRARNLLKCSKECGKSVVEARLNMNELTPKQQRTVLKCSNIIMKAMQLESINLVTDEYIQEIINDFILMEKEQQEIISQKERNHCKKVFECFNNDIIAFENAWKTQFISKFNPVFADQLNDIHIV